jgi:hypothetical protein
VLLTIYEGAKHYARFYQNFVLDYWHEMGPLDYGTMLTIIGVVGWLMMKNSTKR